MNSDLKDALIFIVVIPIILSVSLGAAYLTLRALGALEHMAALRC